MSADALNLINHIKLLLNGKMAEREIDRKIEHRKKKEQESAEFISGLKNIEVQVHPILRMGYVLLHLLRFFVP